MKTVFKATLIILISTVFAFSLLCFIYTIPSEAYETAHNELQLIMENETPGIVDARFSLMHMVLKICQIHLFIDCPDLIIVILCYIKW